MVKQCITVKNSKGLHLRVAENFCELAIEFPCSIFIQSKNAKLNGKSILGVLGACVKQGDEITIICEGEREQEALDALIQLIEDGLGETIEETEE